MSRHSLSLLTALSLSPLAATQTHLVTGQPGMACVERTVAVMGTLLELQIHAEDRASALQTSESVVKAIEQVEARLSTWRPDSELSRVHRAPARHTCALSDATLGELERARHWWICTDGAFDPTIGALVRVYDLRGEGRWPTAAELRMARSNSGAGQLLLTRHGLRRERAGLRIEEGAFGKGAGLDAAALVLQQAGAVDARLDIGGQWLLYGEGAELELAHPRDRSRPLFAWRVPAGSVATSGNSERARLVDGRKLGHLIDPRTGRPADDFGSVSVWCPRAIDADCLATAMFVMGPDAALAFAERHGDVECVILEADDETLTMRASSGARDCVHPLSLPVDRPNEKR